jgi:hypothetical protein
VEVYAWRAARGFNLNHEDDAKGEVARVPTIAANGKPVAAAFLDGEEAEKAYYAQQEAAGRVWEVSRDTERQAQGGRQVGVYVDD